MDTATNARFKNRSLKNTVSESGYKIFVTPVAQSKLDEIQGHARLKVDKAIHSLASVPRSTDCDKFSIKIGCDTHYMVSGNFVISYKLFSNRLTIVNVIKVAESHSTTTVVEEDTKKRIPTGFSEEEWNQFLSLPSKEARIKMLQRKLTAVATESVMENVSAKLTKLRDDYSIASSERELIPMYRKDATKQLSDTELTALYMLRLMNVIPVPFSGLKSPNAASTWFEQEATRKIAEFAQKVSR